MKKINFINKLRIANAIVFGALAVVAATLSLYHSTTLCYSAFQMIVSVAVCAGFPTLFGFLWDDLIKRIEKKNNHQNKRTGEPEK